VSKINLVYKYCGKAVNFKIKITIAFDSVTNISILKKKMPP